MKILKIAAAVAVSVVSLSALAKDPQKFGVADNAFTFASPVSGSQSLVIGAAIEGSYSSQTSVAVAAPHYVTGTEGGSYIIGTQGRYVTGTEGGR